MPNLELRPTHFPLRKTNEGETIREAGVINQLSPIAKRMGMGWDGEGRVMMETRHSHDRTHRESRNETPPLLGDRTLRCYSLVEE